MDEILFTLLSFAPFMLLFWLINLSEKKRTLGNLSNAKVLGWVSYSLVLLSYGLVMLSGLILFLLEFIIQEAPPEHKQKMIEAMDFNFNLFPLGLGLVIPSIIAVILLIPAVRRRLSYLIPIDPNNRLHAISLSLTLLVIIELWSMLAIGLDNLIAQTQPMSSTITIINAWVQDLSFLFIGLLGVGLFTRRNAKEAFKRLGIVRPTLKQIGFGIGVAILLIGVALGLEYVAELIGFGIDKEVNELTEKLIGPLFTTIPGVLTLGLAAAIGEETIFRGAMQPKFGLILTSVLFALIHSNYGLSVATLVVLIAGLTLGVIRNRFNTSTSMVVHATYNIGLGLLSYFQIM